VKFERVAVLGAGVIGASWTSLFLASGRKVAVYDPNPAVEISVRNYVEAAWPVLGDLGLLNASACQDAVSFHKRAVTAVAESSFIQESVPEQLPIKHALYQEIESALDADAIVASSASGLMLSEMQAGWTDPSRFVLGHPFNPPHLIPLVEVMGNEHTGEGVAQRTRQFYESVGKVTIEVNKERPGHVANRLQAAVWREAIHLVKEGVASVEDVDKAMWAGPGLRWAAMGPTLLFHLGAGDGGLAEFCDRYSDSFNRWWDDLGELHLDSDTAALLVEGVGAEAAEATHTELSARRDAMITAMQIAARKYR